ncbi:hypothetical protein DL96DRAFT_1758203 [Flagelloscypha sp. PMI_526]|nr:hypothetical protein DL96DRAFT_1758203 [Flagelloscypha sp. PMI_526]
MLGKLVAWFSSIMYQPTQTVVFAGPSVCDACTLVHLWKTGDYVEKQGSFHPQWVEDVKIGTSNITAIIPSANEGDRRYFHKDILLHAQGGSYHAIVFLLEVDSEESIIVAKKELTEIIEAFTSVPILVLAISGSDSETAESVEALSTQLGLGENSTNLVRISISPIENSRECDVDFPAVISVNERRLEF